MNTLETFQKLKESIETFGEDFVQAKRNKSANRRARSKSVEIRETLKDIRKKLILIEKGIL
jgi:hypothetical protein